MGIQASKALISTEEYLAGELESEIRHEYIGGKIYAMVGASDKHNLIAGSFYTKLYQHLRHTECQVFMSDMKVRLILASEDIFYYPDLMVAYKKDDRATYYREQPVLIVEVLSESTERLDRQEKFLAYRQIDSLQEYLLIAQDQVSVTSFSRDRNWQAEYLGADDQLTIQSIGFSLGVNEIYESVEF